MGTKLAGTQRGELDDLPDIVPDALRRYREQVSALATAKHGLNVQQLAKARGLIDEVLEPVMVSRALVARLTRRNNFRRRVKLIRDQ